MFDDDDSPFLTIDETAEILRIKRRTLDNLRWSGDGPPARRHGGRIVYHRREVLDWSERQRSRTPRPGDTGKAPSGPNGNARPRPPGNRRTKNDAATPPLERQSERSCRAL